MYIAISYRTTYKQSRTVYFSGWSDADGSKGVYHPYTPYSEYAVKLPKTKCESVANLLKDRLKDELNNVNIRIVRHL
jgi:hypothetical protein